MPINDISNEGRDQMVKCVDYFKVQLGKVRTGRASGSLIDGVNVDYYGQPTPVSQVGSVSAPDARTIIIQPYDRSIISDIEKAIRAADLGFNPQNDGTIIRIPVPPLTEDRRKEFVKMCKKYAEEAKVAIRNVRRDMIDGLKAEEKSKLISEDDRKRGEDDVQKITDEYVKQVDQILDKKEKELLED
ncbi:MAG: ribosome recycling factor [Candidatus Kapabacteria bacterium]|nr:ribosome recycling factor [Ignavibacteriota bacterium]MCW5883948.1 ribosome recycling factor [Candidatus Kapabacteria bacterium]